MGRCLLPENNLLTYKELYCKYVKYDAKKWQHWQLSSLTVWLNVGALSKPVKNMEVVKMIEMVAEQPDKYLASTHSYSSIESET